MLAVIFEFEPHPERKQDYLDLAAELNPEVRKIDGFLGIERFESLTRPGHFVSLSFWRDEDALAEWRNVERHREAQRAGREEIFADYRLRVAEIRRDYGFDVRDQAPADSRARHDDE